MAACIPFPEAPAIAVGGPARSAHRASVRESGPRDLWSGPRAHTRLFSRFSPREAIAVMLGTALRRCAVAAAAARAGPRGLLHPSPAPIPAAGKARSCRWPRPRVLAVTWAPATTRGQALPAA